MKRGILLIGLALVIFSPFRLAHAQQAGKVPRIGFLFSLSPAVNADRIEAFRQGLRELGYVEGKNVVIEYRYAEGKRDRLSELAAELVSHKVEIIVTHGEAAIRALKQATQTIPIVVGVTGGSCSDRACCQPRSARRDITGLVDTSPNLSGKRLELLKEILPIALRIAVLWNAANPVKVLDFKETETAAKALGLRLQSLEVKVPQDFAARFKTGNAQRYGALVVLQDALTISNAKRIVAFANTNRLPAMYGSTEFVDVGGLMSYAANFPDLFRRAATYVDKILKGARAGDLPIEQPTKFELIINLKTAKQIGLTVPPNMLARADRVIK